MGGTDYSHGTPNGPLRNHIEKWHKELYLQLVDERGWANQLPSFKAEASHLAVTAIGPVSRTPFSPDGAIEKLVQFIVVNDQVCIHFLLG
jgi:hypothetical protein